MWVFRKALTAVVAVVVGVFVLLGGAVVLLGIGAGMLLAAVLEHDPKGRHHDAVDYQIEGFTTIAAELAAIPDREWWAR
jgi:hypothetical protein